MDTDILIVGGGPAGLQAALTASRVHRRAVLLDDGDYRNAPVRHMHNLIGADGAAPEEFRARALGELAAYDTVACRPLAASEIRPSETGFVADLSDGSSLEARTVILATGVRDELPPIPGLDEVWGGRVAHCPFCHAHEFAGGRMAILGTEPASHLSDLLGPVAGSLTVFPLEGDSADAPNGSDVAASHVVGMRDTGSALELTLADGSHESVAVAFIAPPQRQRSALPERLGLALNDSGCVRVDEFQHTSLPGVFAAGDMAHLSALAMSTDSVASAIASGEVAASSAISHLLGE
ncbi:MAG: NAD(P)/FAD-dependent oxidoreductase [Actinomycetales bacterium]|nr:NAD(P)/FAD-dependent oxidoreductase [Actinomycetales bacterium]